LFDGELGETDYDCGGGCAACALGRRCLGSADCANGTCFRGICVASGCTNGVKDGAETDADCGGGSCLGCAAPLVCAQNTDCDSLRCEAGHCLAPACDDGVRNGKESDLDCGNSCTPCALGRACFSGVDCASGRCEQGACALVCADGLADCDGNPANGCECKAPGGECAAGWADCNGQASDGCETQLSVDAANCGACGSVCEATNASATACVEGACQPTCSAGFGACQSPKLGCSTTFGTSENCAQCGQTCSGAAPYCGNTGCVGYRDIVVTSSGKHAMQGWDGTNENGSIVTVDHTLTSARGSGRMVLLGISAFGTGAGPFTVRYDDQPMTMAVELEHASRESYAAIYYLLDAQLPAAAGTTSKVEVTFNKKAWWGLGGFDVLDVQNAAQQKPLLTSSSAADTCSSSANRGTSLTFKSPGALVYGVLSMHGNSTPPALLQAPPLTEAWAQHVNNGTGNHTGSAAWVIDDDTRSISWATPTCYNSSAVGVVVERVRANPSTGTSAN
jgi:hypothetical protein